MVCEFVRAIISFCFFEEYAANFYRNGLYKLYVAGHAPVGARRERKRDLRFVRHAVALVLRLSETAKEGLARPGNRLAWIGALEGDAGECREFVGVSTVCEVVEEEEVVELIGSEPRLGVVRRRSWDELRRDGGGCDAGAGVNCRAS